MGILEGNPKRQPLHYGEVYGMWVFLHGAKNARAGYETLLNHVGDSDLKNFIKDKMKNVLAGEIEEISEFLKENGVEIPPAPPERPVADRESIPVGARFNDDEIATSISADIAAGLLACSKMMSTPIREDIAAMFGKYHTRKAQYGLKLLQMMKEKAWIVPPPLHNTPEENKP